MICCILHLKRKYHLHCIFSFVNNNPTGPQKLESFIFGYMYEWLGRKWIAIFLLSNLENLLKTDYSLFFLRENHFIFSLRCCKSDLMLEQRLLVKYLSSFAQHTVQQNLCAISPLNLPHDTFELRSTTQATLVTTCTTYSNNQRLGSAFDDLNPRLSLLCDVIRPSRPCEKNLRGMSNTHPKIHPSIN